MDTLQDIGTAFLPYIPMIVASVAIYLLLHFNPEIFRTKECKPIAGEECPPRYGLVVLMGLMIGIVLQIVVNFML